MPSRRTQARKASRRLSAWALVPLLASAFGGPRRGLQPEVEGRARAESGCRIAPVGFDGWSAQEITNRWLRLIVVPQLGGRLMQATFAGHSFLFVNAKYRGKDLPPSEDTQRWINYGGDKIWPMPEGSEDPEHWPGPYSGVLDDGEYKFEDDSSGGRCAARLESPADARTGLQYSREITVGADSPVILFGAEMKNASNHAIRWSVQSVTQYDTADAQNATRYNRDFWAFTRANAQSAYLDGYHVRSGLAEDPSYAVKDGMFKLHWMDLQGEVWVDSRAGWIAVVDGATRFAMVEQFKFERKAKYPGKATVIFYKNGPVVEMNGDGAPEIRTSAEDAPFYMEAELNSPLVRLAPAESYKFETEWLPTRAGTDFRGVTAAGAVGEPLEARAAGERVKLTGRFGVFFGGRVTAHFYDRAGKEIAQDPLARVDPAMEWNLNAEVKAPASAQRVALRLTEAAGLDRGALAEAPIARAAGSR